MRTEKTCRRGQAMIEMAIGMLVFALILGGLISFGSIIPESMRLQTMVRRMAGYDAQRATAGEGDGAPMLALESVLSEPEIRPVSAPEPFSDASVDMGRRDLLPRAGGMPHAHNDHSRIPRRGGN